MSIFTVNVIFPFAPIQKSRALCDNCLVYSTSLVSNNYLGINNCSVEKNFHLLVKVLFPSALLFRLLSVWNIIQLRMSIFTLHVIFALVPIQKSCALCDNSLVYSNSLVSNYYLGLNNCPAENNFHLLVKVLFPSALQLRLLSVWNIIQLRMSIFTLHVIFALVPIQKSCALCDNSLVYSNSLVSNYYLGLNNCPAENNFHLLVKVLFPLLFCLDYCLCETLSSWECQSSLWTSFSPLLLFRKAVLCAITVLYTVPL